MGGRFQLSVELFVLFNFGGLTFDIFLAHSENHFRRESEYIPLYFSIGAVAALAGLLALRARWPAVWRDGGYLVGWLAVAVGLGGVILHLDSQFFYERTIRSLTYGAPFAAPLAYTGLGLLLLVNRSVAPARRNGRSGFCCWRSAVSPATSSSASPIMPRTASSTPPSGSPSSAARSRLAFCWCRF
jgi:hypothetical protein